MDLVLIYSLAATLIISLFSLIGVFGFVVKDKILKKISLYLVAFSTGALLGGAFFHLLPEVADGRALDVYASVLFGIVAFYILEKFVKWRHCHDNGDCDVHTFTYMSLIGDGIHNFIDGLIVVSAFCVSFEAGLATTIAIASHEIPQELSDFGVLIHGGFSKTKALWFNFLTSATAIAGVVLGYFAFINFENISQILLPIAAGGFIYVSMSDLIPELHKEKSGKKSVINILLFVIGLLFMYLTKIYFE